MQKIIGKVLMTNW